MLSFSGKSPPQWISSRLLNQALLSLLVPSFARLRVVSNIGDGDCGAGEIHTRARAKLREDATRGERQKLETTV